MLIVGLGNPGKEYEKTRHNVGFWCADKLAAYFSTKFSASKKYNAEIAEFKFAGETHKLMKPLTYMNNSGESVGLFAQNQNLTATQILVIEDDINLPMGKIRIRANGSAGGHNGLKSIISYIGEDFWRIRIGVGQPVNSSENKTEHEKLISHVLGEVSAEESKLFDKILNSLPEIAENWLSEQGNKAMNKFNAMKW